MRKLFKLFTTHKPKQTLLDEVDKEFITDNYAIYNRIIPGSTILTKEDYKVGFGINLSHYFKINNARKEIGLPIREDYKENYEHLDRDGFYDITGKKIVSKYHELHDKWLVNIKTNERYHIDIVSIQNHFGKVLTLVIRKEGTRSHGVRDWEIISCKDPYTISLVKKYNKEYKIVDK